MLISVRRRHCSRNPSGDVMPFLLYLAKKRPILLLERSVSRARPLFLEALPADMAPLQHSRIRWPLWVEYSVRFITLIFHTYIFIDYTFFPLFDIELSSASRICNSRVRLPFSKRCNIPIRISFLPFFYFVAWYAHSL